eukprot:5741372-Alexandrium_andersonii.AAC.1
MAIAFRCRAKARHERSAKVTLNSHHPLAKQPPYVVASQLKSKQRHVEKREAGGLHRLMSICPN